MKTYEQMLKDADERASDLSKRRYFIATNSAFLGVVVAPEDQDDYVNKRLKEQDYRRPFDVFHSWMYNRKSE